MTTKRKDSKGRVLKPGESQRKDGLYQYRYTDNLGKRRTVYNSDLNKLREEEERITRTLLNGYDYAGGEASVLELVERYCDIKRQNVKKNTSIIYDKWIKKLREDPFGHRRIRDVKMSEAKNWLLKLNSNGLAFNSLKQIRGILKPAFEMGVQDDILHKNPFNFKLDFIPGSQIAREALSPDVIKKFLGFVAEDKFASKYLDIYIILLGTGMRIGELCGLTYRDVDMKLRRINVNHQLNRKPKGGLYVNTPKTKSSNRILPMSDEVYAAFSRVIARRPKLKVEPLVDGYSGFLFVSERGSITINTYVSKAIWSAIKRYNEHHDDKLPMFSPHNLRHTFCTNMIDAGVKEKVVQYLMGHSSVTITLDVYTHSSYRKVEIAFQQATGSDPKILENIPVTTPLLHQLEAIL